MGKSKEKSSKSLKSPSAPASSDKPSTFSLTASEKAIDPSLASLFGTSLGPVKVPKRTYTSQAVHRERFPVAHPDESDSTTIDHEVSTDEDDSEGEEEEISTKQEPALAKKLKATVEAPAHKDSDRRAKRKRGDDLEDQYMHKLHLEEEKEFKKLEEEKAAAQSKPKADEKEEEDESVDEEDGDEEGSEEGDDEEEEGEDDSNDTPKKKESSTPADPPIRHETQEKPGEADLDKSARTIFLGNVPSNAISSKSDYKVFKAFFAAVGKISSIRFRSVAFAEQIPRKAAFVTHKLHEKQKTVNAYIVYKTKEAARAALKLNGSIVLDRHIRVDSVAHPAPHDATRCVFIGNLDFEAQEENLWRHFASCGKVESVRVVRDATTNVGKGFAYVQFEDGTSVEQALMLDGKKMEGDRKLRVSRAKNIKRKQKATNDTLRGPASKKQKIFVPKEDPRQRAMLGRAQKLLGKAGAAKMKKAPEAFIFEGTRASSTANPGLKLGGKRKGGGKSKVRTTKRSTSWKAKAKQ